MSADFDIIHLAISPIAVKKLGERKRNLLVGAMHAHNELTTLNRILMFTQNDTSIGEFHDSAKSSQMWCILQILVGKIFESWRMLLDRLLTRKPADPLIGKLSAEHTASLNWLMAYFGGKSFKPSALKHLRDHTGFHYSGLDFGIGLKSMAPMEDAIYLAEHPANSLYWMGSALVFRTVFAAIGDMKPGGGDPDHGRKVHDGFNIAINDTKTANFHLHLVLYGLIDALIEEAVGTSIDNLEHTRVRVIGAPDPEKIGLPTVVDMGRPNQRT